MDERMKEIPYTTFAGVFLLSCRSEECRVMSRKGMFGYVVISPRSPGSCCGGVLIFLHFVFKKCPRRSSRVVSSGGLRT